MRGGLLVTPAEAEDLPSKSLVDASLCCPIFTLQGVSRPQKFHGNDHADGDAEDTVDVVV